MLAWRIAISADPRAVRRGSCGSEGVRPASTEAISVYDRWIVLALQAGASRNYHPRWAGSGQSSHISGQANLPRVPPTALAFFDSTTLSCTTPGLRYLERARSLAPEVTKSTTHSFTCMPQDKSKQPKPPSITFSARGSAATRNGPTLRGQAGQKSTATKPGSRRRCLRWKMPLAAPQPGSARGRGELPPNKAGCCPVGPVPGVPRHLPRRA